MFLRILIQQLYLQVCNIGKSLKDEIDKEQGEQMMNFKNNCITIVESNLEIFTKKQTVIIEKWIKVDSKRKADLKDREAWTSSKKELEKLFVEIKEMKDGNIILFDKNISYINLDQSRIMNSRLMISKLKKLTEDNMSKKDTLSADQRMEFDRLQEKAKNILEDLKVPIYNMKF